MRLTRGFTLIELLIVLVIVGILVAIIIPQYNEAIISSRRTDAQALLFEVAQKQQQFFSDNNVFTANITSDLAISSTSPDGFYGATVSAGPTGTISTSYLLIATPISSTAQSNDSKCDTLTLNSLGTKGETGTLTVEECWRH